MGDKTYNRDKLPDFNATVIALSYTGSELPTAPAALATGASGDCEIIISADADESVGVDIQQLWRVKMTPIIQLANPGTQSLRIETTPVLGGGTDGQVTTSDVVHPETMDAWQFAAGRTQQP